MTDFSYSTVYPVGLMGIWQKWLCSWARWWNAQIKVNPTRVSKQMNHTTYNRVIKRILQSFHIKIIDFGFARRLNPSEDLRVTEGTPEFVSPEVI